MKEGRIRGIFSWGKGWKGVRKEQRRVREDTEVEGVSKGGPTREGGAFRGVYSALMFVWED